MAKYLAKNSELKNQASAMQKIGKTLASFENRLNSISIYMDIRDGKMASLRSQLDSVKKNIPVISKKIVSSGIAVENISYAYLTAEKSNYYNIQNAKLWDSTNSLFSLTSGFASYLFDKGFIDTATIGMKTAKSISLLQLTKGLAALDVLKGSWDGSIENKYGKYKDPKAIKEIKKLNNPSKQYAYDKETGQMIFYNMAPDYAKKTGTILEEKYESRIVGSLFDLGLSGKNNWGEGSINAKVGTAEMHAELTGGFYVFNKNGEKVLAPSIDAEIGASVCALSLAAAGKVGSDVLSGYAGAEIAALKAEAKGTASVSVVNEKGEIDIQAKAKVSAEAIAFEAKGRAGATVLGTDVGVTGSFEVGVGAHAEVGIVDGIVKVDIGASLGIGVSVGFEVDVGGAVDAVCSEAKTAWKAITKWF